MILEVILDSVIAPMTVVKASISLSNMRSKFRRDMIGDAVIAPFKA